MKCIGAFISFTKRYRSFISSVKGFGTLSHLSRVVGPLSHLINQRTFIDEINTNDPFNMRWMAKGFIYGPKVHRWGLPPFISSIKGRWSFITTMKGLWCFILSIKGLGPIISSIKSRWPFISTKKGLGPLSMKDIQPIISYIESLWPFNFFYEGSSAHIFICEGLQAFISTKSWALHLWRVFSPLLEIRRSLALQLVYEGSSGHNFICDGSSCLHLIYKGSLVL